LSAQRPSRETAERAGHLTGRAAFPHRINPLDRPDGNPYKTRASSSRALWSTLWSGRPG